MGQVCLQVTRFALEVSFYQWSILIFNLSAINARQSQEMTASLNDTFHFIRFQDRVYIIPQYFLKSFTHKILQLILLFLLFIYLLPGMFIFMSYIVNLKALLTSCEHNVKSITANIHHVGFAWLTAQILNLKHTSRHTYFHTYVQTYVH